MTTLKRIIINGTNFYPTTFDVEDMRIGTGTVRMLGGALRFWHRAFKKKFALHWESLPETTISGIRTLYRTNSTFTLQDEDNTSYTVIATSFKTTIDAANISISQTMYYGVDMELEEV